MPTTARLSASNPADIARAGEILRRGGLVAFATETVYGLGANALSEQAVEGIFRAKERPSWDPLIVHVAERAALDEVAHLEDALKVRVDALAAAFWPGPMTLLLPKRTGIPGLVTAGRPLVGVRVPAHRAAQALLRAAGVPVAAPSANRFGHTSPTTAEHVLDDLDGRIDAVLDGGACGVGVESTVLDPAPTPMVIYRAGAVTAEAILERTRLRSELFKPVVTRGAESHPESLPSPGVGLRHYAPEARLVLTEGTPEALGETMRRVLAEETGQVAVMLPRDWPLTFPERVLVAPWGRWGVPEHLAAELFAVLRTLEQAGAEVILCPLPLHSGLGEALRDRLEKAARPR